MWHKVFFNIPFLPAIVFRRVPDRFFKFGMLGAFVNQSSLADDARDSYLQRNSLKKWQPV